jgi:large subunit ribosomal protein L32
MAVPKKRTSRARRDRRRAHDALHISAATESCPNCGDIKLRHQVCPHCGQYKGMQVVEVAAAE